MQQLPKSVMRSQVHAAFMFHAHLSTTHHTDVRQFQLANWLRVTSRHWLLHVLQSDAASVNSHSQAISQLIYLLSVIVADYDVTVGRVHCHAVRVLK